MKRLLFAVLLIAPLTRAQVLPTQPVLRVGRITVAMNPQIMRDTVSRYPESENFIATAMGMAAMRVEAEERLSQLLDDLRQITQPIDPAAFDQKLVEKGIVLSPQ